MGPDHSSNPLQSLSHTLTCVGGQVAANWQSLARQCSGQLQGSANRLASGLQQMPMSRQRRQRHAHPLAGGSWAPALASISFGGGSTSGTSTSSGSSSSGSNGSGSSLMQPLFDLAMAKDEVKARLAPVPVYTVANPKNEFVLVAGENNTQLGFFFFRKEDAEAIIDKIREENPRLARDSKVLRVTMDNVYEVFTTPRDQTGLQGIHFRFMPDMRQVSHALSLYKEAGVPTRSFVGVPVFQAEGLTVTSQEQQYVPLFLCKEDLDVAVGSAYRQRNASQISAYRDKAAQFEAEYQDALKQVESSTGRDKVAAEARVSKARGRLSGAMEKAADVERAPLPKIEVGSFEEVMMRMTASEGPELAAWNQVMFVAPGLLQGSGASGDGAAAGKLEAPPAGGANGSKQKAKN